MDGFRRLKWRLKLWNLRLYCLSQNKRLLIDAVQFFLQTPLQFLLLPLSFLQLLQ
jgi:hypothetical protein